jgi:hypothetical protein
MNPGVNLCSNCLLSHVMSTTSFAHVLFDLDTATTPLASRMFDMVELAEMCSVKYDQAREIIEEK